MASMRLQSPVATGLVARPSPVPVCRAIRTARQPQRAAQRSIVLAHGIPVSGPGAAAATPNPSGAPANQITAALIDSMRVKIGDALETQSVQVQDVYGDGRHVSIDVVSPLFEGKSAVARQRMVYKAIWFELQEAVHAVDAMTTKTPKEASA